MRNENELLLAEFNSLAEAFAGPLRKRMDHIEQALDKLRAENMSLVAENAGLKAVLARTSENESERNRLKMRAEDSRLADEQWAAIEQSIRP
jgi:regulator of replication initiation timing